MTRLARTVPGLGVFLAAALFIPSPVSCESGSWILSVLHMGGRAIPGIRKR